MIAFTGRAGSGKDTAFTLLKEMLPDLTVVRVAFGDEVKYEYGEKIGVCPRVIDSNKKKYRKGLQKWGIAKREKNKAYWIKKIEPQLEFLKGTADVVVITDVRFKNEAAFLKRKYGATIVKVMGPSSRMLKSSHRSEIEMLNIAPDYLLPNDGTLTQLATGVTFLIQEHGLQ